MTIPIVLLHGMTRDHRDFDEVAALLGPHHRVVALDLPAHGASVGHVSGWHWEEVIDSLQRDAAGVIGSEAPVLVGHSLGGMVATLWALRGGCRALVNLDGHGKLAPGRHPGLSPGVVRRRLEEVDDIRRLYVHEQFGAPGSRPHADDILTIQAAIDDLDLVGAYRGLDCPALLVRATRPGPEESLLGGWFEELQASYRDGIARELDALATDLPHVATVAVDTTHSIPLEAPQLVADLVAQALSLEVPSDARHQAIEAADARTA